MKSYRYANLLAVFATILLSFASVADQTKLYFAVPATETGDRPAYSEINLNLAKIETIKKGDIPAIATSPVITKTTTTVRPATPCSDYYGYITIGGKTICLASTNTTAGSLSYNHAYIYNTSLSSNQYIFGHNSAALFGNLKNLSSGTTFNLTFNGLTTSYRISFKESVCDYTNRDQWGPQYDCANYPNSPVLNMNDAILPSRRGADLALMTCDGTPLGNGDATHRLVIYANKL